MFVSVNTCGCFVDARGRTRKVVDCGWGDSKYFIRGKGCSDSDVLEMK
jgi:hypothetical protein